MELAQNLFIICDSLLLVYFSSDYRICVCISLFFVLFMFLTLKVSCKKTRKALCTRRRASGDQLANLPEDVLPLILSKLALNEAVRTSVLSDDWRRIWTFHSKLHFCTNSTRSYYAKNFTKVVHSVIRNHTGVGVEEFTVDFPLNEFHTVYLDRWIKFVISSKIKNLSLLFSYRPEQNPGITCPFLVLRDHFWPSSVDPFYMYRNRYSFPFRLFSDRNGDVLETLCLRNIYMKVPVGFEGFKNLKKLELLRVYINKKELENLLFNCPIVERLCIEDCHRLENFEISFPMLHLKYLSIVSSGIRNIEICAENLVTLCFTGYRANIVLHGTNKLKEAFIWFGDKYLGSALSEIANAMPCLETLHLHCLQGLQVMEVIEDINKFSHLKHLKLIVPLYDVNALSLAPILGAAPLLEKLELHMDYCSHPRRRNVDDEIIDVPCIHLCNLKKVCMTGFVGRDDQLKLANYIIDNAIILEEMVLSIKTIEFRNFKETDQNCKKPNIFDFDRVYDLCNEYLYKRIPRKYVIKLCCCY